jgi:radical SAM superfamily enzyme YgiQ (UPF0313 family)
MDIKLLETLRDAGAARIVWGLETGSPRMLTYIQKNIKLSHVEACLKKSYELGI